MWVFKEEIFDVMSEISYQEIRWQYLEALSKIFGLRAFHAESSRIFYFYY